jgi:hypothetical protein
VRKFDIDQLWEFEPDDLEKMPFYFCSIIAAFKKNGYLGQEYKDLIRMVHELWNSRRYDAGGDKDGWMYQYTSLEVLNKMMKKQNLRLTPATYMNDPEEGKVLFAHMINVAKNSLVKDIITKIKDSTAIDPIAFVRSFSENDDSLIMWNSSYGKEGSGVAVGIMKSMFNKNFGSEFIGLEKPLPSVSLNANVDSGRPLIPREIYQKSQSNDPLKIEFEWLGLYKILYISKESKHEGTDEKDKDDINQIEEIIACLTRIKDEPTDVLAGLLAELFTSIAHIIKDKSYAHEREYRLMYIGSINNLEKYIHHKDGIFLETTKLLFREDSKTDVCLGPKVDDLTFHKYKHAFQHLRLSATLRKSEIKFQ